jgi:hypothetical protein
VVQSITDGSPQDARAAGDTAEKEFERRRLDEAFNVQLNREREELEAKGEASVSGEADSDRSAVTISNDPSTAGPELAHEKSWAMDNEVHRRTWEVDSPEM